MIADSFLTRAIVVLGLLTSLIALSSCGTGTGNGTNDISPEIRQIIDSPEFAHTTWGLLVVDMETGQQVYASLNPALMFDPASTTKLFTVAAAMDTLGADHRFRTPVYRRGEVGPAGQLDGDLTLEACGDLTMGGRRSPDGLHIEYTDYDHTDANALGIGVLTEANPLAGLDDLARQVLSSGIQAVTGDVIIDDRLFGPGRSVNPDEEYVITPIVINDNLIDLSIIPTHPGSLAEVQWRPQTAAYTVINQIITAGASEETSIEIESPSPGTVLAKGQVAVGAADVVRTYQVEDPASFARTLFIEALNRVGVTVNSSKLSKNPSQNLPDTGDHTGMQQVALLESLPFSEYAKLILKVSHNLGADTLLYLIATHEGGKTMTEGLQIESAFLQRIGVDLDGVVLRDGQGSTGSNFLCPEAVIRLLHYMSTRDDFQAYRDALPIMGVDGSLAHLLGPESPIVGKVEAKTGTHIGIDEANSRILLLSRALGGYMTASSGRELAFALYLNNTTMTMTESLLTELMAVFNQHASILEVIYREH